MARKVLIDYGTEYIPRLRCGNLMAIIFCRKLKKEKAARVRGLFLFFMA